MRKAKGAFDFCWISITINPNNNLSLIAQTGPSDRGRVDSVFVLDTTDVVTFGDTNVIEEVLLCGPRVAADLVNLSLELLTDVLLELLELISLSPSLIEEHVANDLDGVSGLTNISDFVLGAVSDAGIGHGVTVVTISEHLEVKGTILDNVLTSPLDGFFNHEDVLCLNLEAWNLVSSLVEFCVVRGSLLTGSHAVGVVLTQVDYGQLPEASHVGSFE